MLFIHGDIVMRLLSKRQFKEMVLYSPQHIARLEAVPCINEVSYHILEGNMAVS